MLRSTIIVVKTRVGLTTSMYSISVRYKKKTIGSDSQLKKLKPLIIMSWTWNFPYITYEPIFFSVRVVFFYTTPGIYVFIGDYFSPAPVAWLLDSSGYTYARGVKCNCVTIAVLACFWGGGRGPLLPYQGLTRLETKDQIKFRTRISLCWIQFLRPAATSQQTYLEEFHERPPARILLR